MRTDWNILIRDITTKSADSILLLHYLQISYFHVSKTHVYTLSLSVRTTYIIIIMIIARLHNAQPIKLLGAATAYRDEIL